MTVLKRARDIIQGRTKRTKGWRCIRTETPERSYVSIDIGYDIVRVQDPMAYHVRDFSSIALLGTCADEYQAVAEAAKVIRTCQRESRLYSIEDLDRLCLAEEALETKLAIYFRGDP